MYKKILAPIVITIGVIIIGWYAFTVIVDYWNSKEITVNNPVINKVEAESQTLNLKSIIHEAENSVIQVESESESSTTTGSGFIFNNKGDILTNAHVIEDADIIYVRTTNAHVYPAAVVGISEETDIAVLRVPLLANQSSLEIDHENNAEIGDEVIALGSPHGYQNTVTLGIISGSERNFSIEGFDYKNVYQISAQISQGNSGGPLLNRHTGKVIGINSVGTKDGMIGFSIPVIDVIEEAEALSAEVANDQLEFATIPDSLSTLNSEQLKENGTYIVEYFFEALQMRDYINAYTILGSSIHSELSYADFRDAYTDTIELDFELISNEPTEDNYVQATVTVNTEEKLKNKDKNKKSSAEYIITIGLENDQLKILKLIKS